MGDKPDLDLDGLERPDPRHDAVRAQVRLTLLDARASSRVGFVLVFLPAAFVFGVILHYGFRLPVPGFGALESGLEWIEKLPAAPLPAALILVGAPLVAFCLNALAITHIRVDRARRELLVTLKLRAMNLIIMVVAAMVIVIVLAHVLAESARHVP